MTTSDFGHEFAGDGPKRSGSLRRTLGFFTKPFDIDVQSWRRILLRVEYFGVLRMGSMNVEGQAPESVTSVRSSE